MSSPPTPSIPVVPPATPAPRSQALSLVVAVAESLLDISTHAHASLGTAVVAGLVIAGARAAAAASANLLAQWTVVRVEVDSRDALYADMLEWMAAAHSYGRSSLHISAAARPPRLAQQDPYGYDSDREDDDEGEAMVDAPADSVEGVHVFPAPGRHFFWYHGRPMILERERADAPQSSRYGASSGPLEELKISTFGLSRTPVMRLLADVRAYAKHRDSSATRIYTSGQYGSWCKLCARATRPLDSVILPPLLKTDLVRDIARFLESKAFYASVGLPYRRGFLLYGPPGTGKSSLVTALAGHFNLPIYVLNLASRALNDSNLLDLMIEAPARCIMLLEDIHTVAQVSARASSSSSTGSKRDKNKEAAVDATNDEDDDDDDAVDVPTPTKSKSKSKSDTTASNDSDSDSDGSDSDDDTPVNDAPGVSFAMILNILDGVLASEGRVLFMTSNSTALPAVLTRPGRIDRKLYLGNATAETAVTLVSRFFPDVKGAALVRVALARFIVASIPSPPPSTATSTTSSNNAVTDAVRALAAEVDVSPELLIVESTVSPAQVVGYLMQYRDDPAGAAANIDQVASMHEFRSIS
ncbi:BCS1 N terminal-domain-containing protein [Blastocladiella britannica]|nr:BCS1 N terminal-domain-containing protein [Blastocladiella britannica]